MHEAENTEATEWRGNVFTSVLCAVAERKLFCGHEKYYLIKSKNISNSVINNVRTALLPSRPPQPQKLHSSGNTSVKNRPIRSEGCVGPQNRPPPPAAPAPKVALFSKHISEEPTGSERGGCRTPVLGSTC